MLPRRMARFTPSTARVAPNVLTSPSVSTASSPIMPGVAEGSGVADRADTAEPVDGGTTENPGGCFTRREQGEEQRGDSAGLAVVVFRCGCQPESTEPICTCEVSPAPRFELLTSLHAISRQHLHPREDPASGTSGHEGYRRQLPDASGQAGPRS